MAKVDIDRDDESQTVTFWITPESADEKLCIELLLGGYSPSERYRIALKYDTPSRTVRKMQLASEAGNEELYHLIAQDVGL